MICIKCNKDKPLTDFYKRKSRSKKNPSNPVYKTICNQCSALYTRLKRLEYFGHTSENIEQERQELEYGASHPSQRKCRFCGNWKEGTEFTLLPHSGQSRKTKNTCDQCERQRKRDWVKNNPQKQKLASSQWKKNNPDKIATYNHTRRTKKVGNLGSQQIQDLRMFYCPEGGCMSCGKTTKLTLDHVIPIHVGGLNLIDNIQFLCQSCNSRKRTNVIDYRWDAGAYAKSLSVCGK